jgi:uncharacterized membrane protein
MRELVKRLVLLVIWPVLYLIFLGLILPSLVIFGLVGFGIILFGDINKMSIFGKTLDKWI